MSTFIVPQDGKQKQIMDCKGTYQCIQSPRLESPIMLSEVKTSSSAHTTPQPRSSLPMSAQPVEDDKKGSEKSFDTVSIKRYFSAHRQLHDIHQSQDECIIQQSLAVIPSVSLKDDDGGVILPSPSIDDWVSDYSMSPQWSFYSPYFSNPPTPLIETTKASTQHLQEVSLAKPQPKPALPSIMDAIVFPPSPDYDAMMAKAGADLRAKAMEKMIAMRTERQRLFALKKTDLVKWREEIAIKDEINRVQEIIKENLERQEQWLSHQVDQDELWMAEMEDCLMDFNSLREKMEDMAESGKGETGLPASVEDKGEGEEDEEEEDEMDPWDYWDFYNEDDETESCFVATYFETESSGDAKSEVSSTSEPSAVSAEAAAASQEVALVGLGINILQPRPVRPIRMPSVLSTVNKKPLFPEVIDRVQDTINAVAELESGALGRPTGCSLSKTFARLYLLDLTHSVSIQDFLCRSRGILAPILNPPSVATLMENIQLMRQMEVFEAQNEVDIAHVQNIRTETQRRQSLIRVSRSEFVEDHAFLPKSLRSRQVVDKEQERLKYEEEIWKMRCRRGGVCV